MRVFNLSINEQQLQIVLTSLAEMPYKHSAPILEELGKQVQAQLNPPKQEELPKE